MCWAGWRSSLPLGATSGETQVDRTSGSREDGSARYANPASADAAISLHQAEDLGSLQQILECKWGADVDEDISVSQPATTAANNDVRVPAVAHSAAHVIARALLMFAAGTVISFSSARRRALSCAPDTGLGKRCVQAAQKIRVF